ncbi:flagellar basal body rod protein FlgC [Candidatus Saganbacteria bacterium]|nr:flagellar basal body rod protein FlgC [Candidatus Saganbacteria bacterium]
MGISRALEISISAIEAEKLRMEAISSNIANVNTTRTLDGGPYKRREVLFLEKPLSFDEELYIANNKIEKKTGGVKVAEIVEDKTPLQKVYNPTHPDADKNGMVQMPNVKLSKEMVDMVESSKMYEANITAYNTTKKMMQDTLQIP